MEQEAGFHGLSKPPSAHDPRAFPDRPSLQRKRGLSCHDGPSLQRKPGLSCHDGPSLQRKPGLSCHDGPSLQRKPGLSCRDGPSLQRKQGLSCRDGPSLQRKQGLSCRATPCMHRSEASSRPTWAPLLGQVPGITGLASLRPPGSPFRLAPAARSEGKQSRYKIAAWLSLSNAQPPDASRRRLPRSGKARPERPHRRRQRPPRRARLRLSQARNQRLTMVGKQLPRPAEAAIDANQCIKFARNFKALTGASPSPTLPSAPRTPPAQGA